MTVTPTVVGINRTQDGSVCVMRGPTILYSLQKERITRRKHHWGRPGDVRDLYLPRLACLAEPVDLVVECYSSDSEVENVEGYHRELAEVMTFRDGPRIERVSPWSASQSRVSWTIRSPRSSASAWRRTSYSSAR